MRFYDNEILAIFKNLLGIQNNRYNPVIRLKSFALWLLFWSFYGGGHSLQFLRIFWKREKYFDKKKLHHIY